MSRTIKIVVVGALVSMVASVPFAVPTAFARPSRIRETAVTRAVFDWQPAHGPANVAPPSPNWAGATIPMFTSSVHDGTSTFNFMMVGKDPFVRQPHPSTLVHTTLIPVVVKFSDGKRWDPRAITSCDSRSALARTRKSPIFESQTWKFGGTRVGKGQYIDAFQRAEFYSQTNPTGLNPGYHVRLALDTHAPLVLDVPDADAGETAAACGNHTLGVVDPSYLDSQIQGYITDTLGPAATRTLPIFLLDNVALQTTPCCALGYHGAMKNAGTFQTYAVASYDTSQHIAGSADTAALSHEVAETINDPSGFNITKPWHNPFLPFCQLNLEVADPLVGSNITDGLNGMTYHLQEIAFSSWFYHSTPSLGVNGWYSSNGTLRTSAPPCT